MSNGESERAHDSERDNAVRFDPGAHRGHVESHFLKANSPDGLRAIWIKHTLLVRPDAPEQNVAEVWAIAFSREKVGGPVEKRAIKRTLRLRDAAFTSTPFHLALLSPVVQAVLQQGRAHAELAATESDGGAHWDIAYACPEQSFRPFPYARMYEARFPRSKSLTPVPRSRARGVFQLGSQRWDITDFVLAQGHNWGESHAHAYAWTQVNRFAGGEDAWLEALTGQVRVGPLTTPWLSVAALYLDGVLHRFDGARALLSRAVRIDTRSYTLTLRAGESELRLRIAAESDAFAGLCYRDPDGSSLACLNSKLACAEVTLTAQGRTRTLKSDLAALELGTRNDDHGLTILA